MHKIPSAYTILTKQHCLLPFMQTTQLWRVVVSSTSQDVITEPYSCSHTVTILHCALSLQQDVSYSHVTRRVPLDELPMYCRGIHWQSPSTQSTQKHMMPPSCGVHHIPVSASSVCCEIIRAPTSNAYTHTQNSTPHWLQDCAAVQILLWRGVWAQCMHLPEHYCELSQVTHCPSMYRQVDKSLLMCKHILCTEFAKLHLL